MSVSLEIDTAHELHVRAGRIVIRPPSPVSHELLPGLLVLDGKVGRLVGWIEPADAQVGQFRHEPLPPADAVVRVGLHRPGEVGARVQQSVHGSSPR